MINKKKEKKKKFSLSSYYVSDTVTLSLLMSLNFYWTVFFSTYTYLMIYTHKKDFIFNQVTNQGYDVSAGEEQSHEFCYNYSCTLCDTPNFQTLVLVYLLYYALNVKQKIWYNVCKCARFSVYTKWRKEALVWNAVKEAIETRCGKCLLSKVMKFTWNYMYARTNILFMDFQNLFVNLYW